MNVIHDDDPMPSSSMMVDEEKEAVAGGVVKATSLVGQAVLHRDDDPEDQEDDDDNNDSEDRSSTILSEQGLWKLRSSARWLIQDRESFLAPSPDVTDKPTAGGRGSGGLPLTAAYQFPMEDSIDFVRTQKLHVVQEAFRVAAGTILQAIRNKRENSVNDQETTDDDREEDQREDDDEPIPDLPPSLNDRHHISMLRHTAFGRSLGNKEWAKKRVLKAQSATSSYIDSLAGEALEGSGSKRGVGGRKRKADAITHEEDGADTNAMDHHRLGEDLGGHARTDGTKSGGTTAPSSSGPKFTRNTPASSAAALDHRFTNARAILCAAGNLVMAALTPDLAGHELEPNDVPQKKTHSSVNLAAVLVDANVYAQRTITIAENAVKRADMRNQYRKENARYNYRRNFYPNKTPNMYYLQLPNLFDLRSDSESSSSSWGDFMFEEEEFVKYSPNKESMTEPWNLFCLPRLQAILQQGSGHVLYHDIQWFSRHGRLAHLLKTLRRPNKDTNDILEKKLDLTSKKSASFGPHLIVTTQPDTTKFAQEFHDMRIHVPLVYDQLNEEQSELRVLVYAGNREQRRKLRRHFARATGVAEAPFHVIVVSYTVLLEEYLHFCQLPFEVVILDHGASWMAASHGDPNSSLATVWQQGIWNGHTVGAAGIAVGDPWDFNVDKISEPAIKEAFIGLTARHRIMTASHLVAENKSSVELLPISGVVSFLSPIFASVVQEEWDRSNIAKDADSMQHFRKLVARSMVIHHQDSPLRDMHEMALLGLEGQLGFTERFGDPIAPDFITDDDFVASDKVTFSRRACLSWLGTKSVDWLRYELGSANFDYILDAMKVSTKHGHYCQEVTTASSTTSSGANGQVGGTMAYRMAVCCLRHFGSEQGLRQHISAQHAPPGTWLCRTCGSDCITSQARTHHERTCGQPATGPTNDPTGSLGGATPTVGQGGTKGGVGKKKSQRSSTAQTGGTVQEEKDPNGALRVPGYRGVWVNKEGKHFIKIDKDQYTGDGDEVVLFDSNDAAARRYDEVISKNASENQTLELNFKPDGTRNIYEDATSSTASGLGGSAANVVPLLSVINIKDLPPDVKPLLRDPRQTSRTGGNSKRHIYAYRGVCRQARKGHDRWQSQISFMGVNHYLGTFDSEWDAAAIYAWAHLILYGEEATKQAQKEGEEAAEAYEQEKRDLAAGKIPAEPPKPEKTKKQTRRKSDQQKNPRKTKGKTDSVDQKEEKKDGPKKRKTKPKEPSDMDKKGKVDLKSAKSEKEAMNATLSLGVTKTPVLGERDFADGMEMSQLESMMLARLRAVRGSSYCVGDFEISAAPAASSMRTCLPLMNARGSSSLGIAVLLGLSCDIGWNLNEFVAEHLDERFHGSNAAHLLAEEYEGDGINENFKVCVQGSTCILGRATSRMTRIFTELVGNSVSLGRGVGEIDCHVGGIRGSCSRRASCIRYAHGRFQLCCLSDHDVVTLNGERITVSMGWIGLEHNDVCSVGPRVFVFVLPN